METAAVTDGLPNSDPGALRSLPSRALAWGRGAVAVLVLGPFALLGRGADVSFNRDIRPILSDHCFACHGPDEKTRKAGLRLDSEDEAHRRLKSGKTAVVPGHPEASELVARIVAADPDDQMPPASTKKPLSPRAVEMLKRWVAEGARYEGHWAYLAPERPVPPEVRRADWPRNDLDRFVLARLEREGLQPAREAPKEKLLRRVTLDLTGLPPTAEEMDAFLANPSEQAYEKVVDRLLASPHYGERMAQHWLDLARYGETQGYHHDRHRDLWRWRDWTIRAFNDNQRFDQFTYEQLAGDLLPNPTRDQLIATGFHRNEMTTSEGGALPEEYIVKYAVGRVDTTARVWLGTSMACAECHDHKYDPISQKEYYRFFAFFFDTPENGLDAEELNPSPRITLETAEERERASQLDRQVAALEAAEKMVLESPRSDWDEAETAWATRHRTQSLGAWSSPPVTSAGVATEETLLPDSQGAIGPARTGDRRKTAYDLVLHLDGTNWKGLRLDFLPDTGASADAARENPRAKTLLTHLEAEVRSRDPAREGLPDDPPKPGSWWVIGPFAAGSAREAYDREFGPEKSFDLKATYQDGKLAWRERKDWQDADSLALEGRQRALYLARVLIVREPRVVDADFEGADGLRVWLNGRPVLAAAPGNPAEGGTRRVKLWLRAGENRLLVKLANGDRDDRLALQLGAGSATAAGLEWAMAAADRQSGEHPAGAVLDRRPETGWEASADPNEVRSLFLRTHEAFGFRGGTELRLKMTFQGGNESRDGPRFRVLATESSSLAEFMELPEDIRRILRASAGQGTEADRLALRKFYRGRYVAEARETQQLLAAKRKERDDFRNGWPTAMVMRSANPARETRIRIRGQYDNLGEKVEPGVPERLFPWRDEYPRNRLGLARWLMDPRHPLTARVVVNQYWQRYFGAGLVKTSEDFGAQGEWPSHPQLLDWLATEFVRLGWDVKAMQRLIVTSATYRQDSVVSRELLERDAENRLLARGARFRLDAENIRDLAMAASGLLNPRIGGPSVFPYQPPGLWGQVSFEGTRDYVQSEGAENYRRGLYTYWRRSIPYASFTVFDAPSREVCTVRRPRTNTPLQALALMNDPVYVEAARALGQRILNHGGRTLPERIRFAFRVVLGRLPTEREQAVVAAACEREMKRFAEDREAANRLVHAGASRPPVDVDIVELAAWTLVAQTLLNLDETITKG